MKLAALALVLLQSDLIVRKQAADVRLLSLKLDRSITEEGCQLLVSPSPLSHVSFVGQVLF